MAETSVDPCPDCGAAMRLRVNRATGAQFWGCSQYPSCAGTRPHTGEASAPGRDDRDSLPSERQRARDRRRWDQ